MKSTQTIIKGYRVELDIEGPEEPTQCFVFKGKHSASLAALSMTGCLSYSNWDDIRVPEEVIEAIESWAVENGY